MPPIRLTTVTTVSTTASSTWSREEILLADVECGGKQVHDANVVATMLVHGINTVVAMNSGDFSRFDGYVSLIKL